MRERRAIRKSAATRRRLRAACTAVLAVLGVVLPLPAASAATVDTSASYVLVNRNSGKALDVYGRSTADGARISQYTRNDGAWQQWRFFDSGDGYYRVRSVHSNKVLGFSSTADRTGLTQGTDADRPAQRFRLADSTGGYVRLLNRASGKAVDVDVAGSSTADPWVYVLHTTSTDNRVVRIRYTDGALAGTPQVLLTGIPRNKYHNGGRLRFGPDGTLYIATGDGQNGDWAQELDNLAGKVLRVNRDGTVPSDNPFGTAVWSYGHRNPQGLAFDSQGRLWEQEFGNSVMDETNLIVRGGNYGWPICEGTTGSCGEPGFVAPKRTYPVADGSCSGIAVVRDALYIACLRGARLYRAEISGESLTNVQQYLTGTYGRPRTVEPSADGGLWLTTSTRGDKDSVANNSDESILKVELGR